MADKKISELTVASALAGTEELELVQGGVNKKTTAQDIANLSGGGSVTSVSGTTNRITSTGGATPVLDIDAAYDAAIVATAVAAVPDADETTKGIAELSTQAETNTGTDDARIVTPLKIKNLDQGSTAITDGATVDISGPKHTWTTNAANRTVTVSFVGDSSLIYLTLNTTGLTITFPASFLTVFNGAASGDNSMTLNGTSGDRYVIGVFKFGSDYVAIGINIGQ